MGITQKELADMAGVAVSTVSRALNDKQGVSQETREKILDLAKEYNYKPNRMAQGLAKQKTNMLALLLPDLKNPENYSSVDAVEKVIEQTNYQLVICNSRGSEIKSKNYLDLLKLNQFDGALIVGGTKVGTKLLELAPRHENIVLINLLLEELLMPSHLVNYQEGGRLAAKELSDNKKVQVESSAQGPFVMLMGSTRDYIDSKRRQGFVEYCQSQGIDYEVFSDVRSREDGYQAFLDILEEYYPPPDGFYLTSNMSAIGLIEAIKMGGYLIPEDFQIIGTGNNHISELAKPELTVIKEPLREIASSAAQNLLELVKNSSSAKDINVYNPTIEVKGTTLK